jgi:DNA-binding HxlR family transcriptional regulator
MKGYDQYCPIAHSLGLVGERWTLLVVRELLYGPNRYTDLAERLPGIGSRILAERLKELEAAGLVTKRRMPPPAASTVYELTDEGRMLKPVLHELSRFGARLLGPPPAEALVPGWLQHALYIGLSPVSPAGTIAFHVGDEEASLVEGVVTPGIADGYDVLVEADPTCFYKLVTEGNHDGVRIEGDRELLEQLIRAFAPEPSPAEPQPVN